MSETAIRWLDAIRSAVREIAGEEQAAEAENDWQRHACRPCPVVTIYGPYDSGKSTLIKRLIVEDGTPVPAWLTISGRRETFELGEIESEGLTYRDTPGIAAGDDRHELIADEALLTTDALVLVLPPQLMTTGLKHMLSIITGIFYNPETPMPYPEGALLLVIARADEMAADPLDDLDGFRDTCQRKKEELLALLQRHADPATMRQLPPVHVISADLDGLNAKKRQPAPDDYPPGVPWDGISALLSALQTLAQRRDGIRQAAANRYWSWITAQLRDRCDEELSRVTAAAGEARRERAHIEALEEQLNGIAAAAEADLRALVRDELRSITDGSPIDDPEAMRAEAERRLDLTASAWLGRWSVALSQLAQSAAGELTARAQRPGAAAYRQYLDELLKDPAPTRSRASAESTLTMISHLSQWTPQIGSLSFKLHTGMSAAEAHAELARIKALHGADLTDYFSSGTGFSGPEQAADARKHLKHLELTEFVPLLVEFSAIIWGQATQRRLEREERDRSTKLREDIEQAAKEISDRILDQGHSPAAHGWHAAVHDLRKLLQGRMPPESLLASMQQQQLVLTTARITLTGLLATAPH
jgi:hypothetical protein